MSKKIFSLSKIHTQILENDPIFKNFFYDSRFPFELMKW